MSKHKALELADGCDAELRRTVELDVLHNNAAAMLRAQHALIVQMWEALTVGLEAAQELLAMKREALGDDDYAKTRSYWETEREVCAAIAAADQYLKDNP